MAKKIIIAFNENLDTGTGSNFTYSISIDGKKIIFANGTDKVDIGYNTIADVPPNSIKVYPLLNDTIEKTLDWLSNGYANSILSFSRLENTIEVFIDSENVVITDLFSSNIGIVVSAENVNIFVEGEVKLKYFFQYQNGVNDEYRFEIYQTGYTGNSTEIHGRAVIEKGSIKNHLDPIRGTSVNVELEANKSLTLQDLYTQNELEFPVKLFRNGFLIFRGYLNPEGVYMSFVREEWKINLDCVDGLGAIENLSFVQDNGLQFVGKMNAQDIVFYCLRRTGLLQRINTSVNIFYDGYADLPNRNIFEAVEMNADRFVKKDSDTIMSCGEVLKSVLDIFNATITQEDGEWYICRPNELYETAYVDFKKYDISNNYIQTVKKNLNKKIGDNINKFYPHHCSGNQRIQIKGSISAFRLNYKYGFIASSILNPTLQHDDELNYDFWTKYTLLYNQIINDPTKTSGVYINSIRPNSQIEKLLTSSNLFLLEDSTFKFETDISVFGARTGLRFRVRLDTYYLKKDGTWSTSPTDLNFVLGVSDENAWNYPDVRSKFTVNANPTPVAGNVYVEIYTPYSLIGLLGRSWPVLIRSVNILVTTGDTSNKEGEFHTVQRANVSSNIKENKEVFNGDSVDEFFNGAIFKTGGAELTEVWNRKNYVESKPLLRIVAEESLRISQRPGQIFSGDFYGYLPYLSVIEINGLSGKFMPLEWRYDTYSNIGTHKLLELYSGDLPDITYKFTFDYGTVVSPTIIG